MHESSGWAHAHLFIASLLLSRRKFIDKTQNSMKISWQKPKQSGIWHQVHEWWWGHKRTQSSLYPVLWRFTMAQQPTADISVLCRAVSKLGFIFFFSSHPWIISYRCAGTGACWGGSNSASDQPRCLRERYSHKLSEPLDSAPKGATYHFCLINESCWANSTSGRIGCHWGISGVHSQLSDKLSYFSK